jgi:predicted nucleic acid-binding protein
VSVYVDSSALLKALVEESESDALVQYLEQAPEELVSSRLTYVETHRVAVRLGVPPRQTDEVLSSVALLRLEDAQITRAAHLPAAPGMALGSLDAIHLAAAADLGVSVLVSYDRQMIAAARALGYAVVVPGRED